ncbi:MAG: gluconolactonase [Verrucomicrobiales bacterium]|jgi:gluconolactonase
MSKTEAKPIRIFLQDGSNDLAIYGSSWWMANQNMISALQFSGYDECVISGALVTWRHLIA